MRDKAIITTGKVYLVSFTDNLFVFNIGMIAIKYAYNYHAINVRLLYTLIQGNYTVWLRGCF